MNALCTGFICESDTVDDDSSCVPAVTSNTCGYYKDMKCNGDPEQAPPVCPTSCVTHADCDASARCDEEECKPKLPNGGACSEGADCLSNMCVDGYCCDSPCDGDCQTCGLAGMEGTCSGHAVDTDPENDCGLCEVCNGNSSCVLVPEGEDPVFDCPGYDQSTCKLTGTCSGFGTCSLWEAFTVCEPAECTGHVFSSEGICNGLGTCIGGDTLDCMPYLCNDAGDACQTDCVDDTDCMAAFVCNGANKCVPKDPVGNPCDDDADCVTGFCVDGVCCNDACDGECQACDEPGMLGICTYHISGSDPEDDCGTCQFCNGVGGCKNVLAGLDPMDDCSTEDVSTCGLDGKCSGGGACSFYAAGSVCVAQSCAAGTQQNADTCDGAAACVDNGTTDCFPYVCNGDWGCYTACVTDAECASGTWCQGGECIEGKGDGETCTEDDECSSSKCVDGFCCNTVCDGACESCALPALQGTCSPYGGNTDPEDECGLCMSCDGDGACAASSAGLDPHDECVQTIQFTCGLDGSCDGNGACRNWLSGTICSAQSCADGTVDLADTCDGIGGCQDNGTQPCSPYFCNPMGTACADSCADDTECVADHFCDGSSKCQPKKPNGETCGGGNECISDLCIDGYCCDALCDGLCESCAVPGALGACSPVGLGLDPDDDCPFCEACNGAGACGPAATGTDPGNDCLDEGASECDQDGTCDGSGACRIYLPGSICHEQLCVGDTLHLEDTCDGLGDCIDAGTSPCYPYACADDGSDCRTDCTEHFHCASDHFCDAGACVPKKDDGETCDEGPECISSFCADGYCCDKACLGECDACNFAGLEGTCTLVPNGTDPNDSCGVCRVCNGTGDCVDVAEGLDLESECELEAVDSCGFTGHCDGGGACAFWANGFFCQEPSCVESTFYLSWICDGMGSCVGG